MNATNKADAIKEFLEVCSEPRRNLELRWSRRETFYDDNVQTVLMERHPSKWSYETPPGRTYPVRAWQVADQQQMGTNPLDETEIDALDISRTDREWFARLTLAVCNAWKQFNERMSKPQTGLEKFLVWRHRWFLEQETGTQYTPEEVARVDAIIKNWNDDGYGAKPMTIRTKLGEPEKYQQALVSIFGGQKIETEQATAAIRQAVFKENKRRDAIMRTWAESWLIHIRGTYLPESAADIHAAQTGQPVTKPPPNK